MRGLVPWAALAVGMEETTRGLAVRERQGRGGLGGAPLPDLVPLTTPLEAVGVDTALLERLGDLRELVMEATDFSVPSLEPNSIMQVGAADMRKVLRVGPAAVEWVEPGGLMAVPGRPARMVEVVAVAAVVVEILAAVAAAVS